MLYIEARQIAINGSNRYEWLSLLDDPTPAESAASNNKEKRTYAQVTLNNRENLKPHPKPRNILRKNSIKRCSRNDLKNLDTTNNPVTQVEQIEPKNTVSNTKIPQTQKIPLGQAQQTVRYHKLLKVFKYVDNIFSLLKIQK